MLLRHIIANRRAINRGKRQGRSPKRPVPVSKYLAAVSHRHLDNSVHCHMPPATSYDSRISKMPSHARLQHFHQWHKDVNNTKATQNSRPRLLISTHPLRAIGFHHPTFTTIFTQDHSRQVSYHQTGKGPMSYISSRKAPNSCQSVINLIFIDLYLMQVNGIQAISAATYKILSSTRTWALFLYLARNQIRLCSVNHRPGYWSNLPCDWPSTAWTYSALWDTTCRVHASRSIKAPSRVK